MRIINHPVEKMKNGVSHEEMIKVFDKAAENKKWRDYAIECFYDDKEKFSQLKKEGKINILTFFIENLIDIYCDIPFNEEKFEMCKKVVKSLAPVYIVDIKIKGKLLLIQTTHGPIKAKRLTDVIPSITDKMPLDKREKRVRNCHWSSIFLSDNLQNKHYLATGYAGTFAEKTKYLHTWVEVPRMGRPALVLDPANNLVMNKWNYYLLFHIHGPVHRILDKELQEDKGKLDALYDYDTWYSKLYLSNRKLALAEYEKLNKQNFNGEIEKNA